MFTKISRVFSALLIAGILLGNATFPTVVRADVLNTENKTNNNMGLPVAQLLNPDGTLNLSTGYAGKLDITGHGVILEPMRGPIFSSLSVAHS